MDKASKKTFLKDLFYKLPDDPFSETRPQAELDSLFYIKTGEHLPQGLNKMIEKITILGKEKEYLAVLIAMAEKRLKQYKKRNDYPSMKNDFNKRIKEIKEYISNLKEIKKKL